MAVDTAVRSTRISLAPFAGRRSPTTVSLRAFPRRRTVCLVAAIVTLEPDAVTLEPDTLVTIEVHVSNTGPVVNRFHFQILGEMAGCAEVVPAELGLFPGADGTVTVRFLANREACSHGRNVPFAVK